MTAAPKTRKIRIQDLEPGMRMEQIDSNLDFAYLVVKRIGRLGAAYSVRFLDDTDDRPVNIRPRQMVTVLDEPPVAVEPLQDLVPVDAEALEGVREAYQANLAVRADESKGLADMLGAHEDLRDAVARLLGEE